jgi:NAD(P)-dependent dehydrogenase (short-subunit alcohol dehydrogenase family)
MVDVTPLVARRDAVLAAGAKVNIHGMFYLTKAAVPHMQEGSAVINTASINADAPNPTLLGDHCSSTGG